MSPLVAELQESHPGASWNCHNPHVKHSGGQYPHVTARVCVTYDAEPGNNPRPVTLHVCGRCYTSSRSFHEKILGHARLPRHAPTCRDYEPESPSK